MSSQGPANKQPSDKQIDFLAKLFESTNVQQFTETVPESTETVPQQAAQTDDFSLVSSVNLEDLSQYLPVVEAYYDETEEEHEAQERRAPSRNKPGKR
ncbi:MAG: hypothetical protein AB7I18_01890 [Candidatus Berkiella sp.]